MSDHPNLVFGVNPVLEKLRASAKDILEILISESSDRGALRQISQEAARLKLPVTAVPRAVLDRLAAGQRHQGVVAKIEAYRYLPFEALLEKISGSLNSEWILILDSLTDPRNFGALLRAAEAVGIRYIIIPKDRSVQVTPLVVNLGAHTEIADASLSSTSPWIGFVTLVSPWSLPWSRRPHQPRSRHSRRCGRSVPSVVSLP